MKRMHVHVAVDDLPRAIGFYSALFATAPSVTKPDYAKWMLDDPRVNFAISTRSRRAGLDHLGIQVEDKAELNEIYARLHQAGGAVRSHPGQEHSGSPCTVDLRQRGKRDIHGRTVAAHRVAL